MWHIKLKQNTSVLNLLIVVWSGSVNVVSCDKYIRIMGPCFWTLFVWLSLFIFINILHFTFYYITMHFYQAIINIEHFYCLTLVKIKGITKSEFQTNRPAVLGY